MRTDQLIDELVSRPVSVGNARLRVALAVIGGWFGAVACLALVEGTPMAAVAHTGAAPFAVKLGFAVALASLAVMAAIAAGRPGQRLTSRIAMIAAPLILVLAVASIELASTNRANWNAMLFGAHYWSCFASVSLASLPVFAGMIWAYRILAPTRLALAGFLIGLSAGAAGAAAFALYCH